MAAGGRIESALVSDFLRIRRPTPAFYTSSTSTFIHCSSGAGFLLQDFGWLVVTLLSLSLASVVVGVLSMQGAAVTAEPDLENDWHPLYNPFRKVIVVEE